MKNNRYQIHKLKGSMAIDANWDKPQWQAVPELSMTNMMGAMPVFLPDARARVLYDDNNLYVIFKVRDQFVRAVARGFNSKVWEDACVELFFAPDQEKPLQYFNVEINCGGTALVHYNRKPDVDVSILPGEDLEQVEIAHSLPDIVDPEMTEPVVWTLEYRLPFSLLKKYSAFSKPGKGVIWRANLQKCAENNSNPHWLTWSKIDYPTPRFHMPEYFGYFEFQD